MRSLRKSIAIVWCWTHSTAAEGRGILTSCSKTRVPIGSSHAQHLPCIRPSWECAALPSECLGVEKDWICTRRLKCSLITRRHRKFATKGVQWKMQLEKQGIAESKRTKLIPELSEKLMSEICWCLSVQCLGFLGTDQVSVTWHVQGKGGEMGSSG